MKFDGVVFAAKVVDLPSVVELWKTFDKKSMWKTGDLCQVGPSSRVLLPLEKKLGGIQNFLKNFLWQGLFFRLLW